MNEVKRRYRPRSLCRANSSRRTYHPQMKNKNYFPFIKNYERRDVRAISYSLKG